MAHKVEAIFGDYSIKELRIDGNNIAEPFGFETSTRQSRLRLSDGVSKNISTKKFSSKKSKTTLITHESFEMVGGAISVDFYEKALESGLLRENDVVFDKDSEVFDLVQRFRFKKECVAFVEIAGQRLLHKNSNKNYMYKTDRITLELSAPKGARVEIKSSEGENECFEPHFYARDSGNEWIIHYRMLPKEPYNSVVMVNHPMLDAPLPDFISKILLAFSPIRNFLWYKGEMGMGGILHRVPLNAYACKHVPAAASIKLKTELKVL